MRQVVLDTETTGLESEQGHRIVEIGGVELIDRRLTDQRFHRYLNPQREIDEGAREVHGLDSDFLQDKPTFADICEELVGFLKGAELIIHNAPFDVSFLNYELSLMEGASRQISDLCQVTDSLVLARERHPGQKNGLEALCRRYGVDDSARQRHGALMDAELLAEVYLAMTGGQTKLFADAQGRELSAASDGECSFAPLPEDRPPLKVVRASAEELAAHERMLDQMGDACVWRQDSGAASGRSSGRLAVMG